MKLRIRGNSLRLRLLQAEVATLAETGAVSETISFGGSELVYAISAANAVEISAQFSGGAIVIFVPDDMIRQWAGSTQVSIEKHQSIDGDGNTLKILIEKDFVCTGRENDPDNADAFPNPAAAAEC